MFICSQSPKKGTQQCNLGAFQLPLNKIAGLPRSRLDVAAGVLYRLMCSASQLACESPSRQFKAISGISTVFCDLWRKLALSKKFMTWERTKKKPRKNCISVLHVCGVISQFPILHGWLLTLLLLCHCTFPNEDTDFEQILVINTGMIYLLFKVVVTETGRPVLSYYPSFTLIKSLGLDISCNDFHISVRKLF